MLMKTTNRRLLTAALLVTSLCGVSSACNGSEDATAGGPATDPSHGDAGPADPNQADATPRPRLSGMPAGIAGMTALDRLPVIDPFIRAGHESSFDRSGGNFDYSQSEMPEGVGSVPAGTNDLGVDEHGDRIVLDRLGPGCLYRMWFVFHSGPSSWGEGPGGTAQVIKVYFDDEAAPRINTLTPPYPYPNFASFFSGQAPPANQPALPAPLVWNFDVSSGGYYSYVPMPFSRRVRVTVACNPSHNGCDPGAGYFNFDVHQYEPSTEVTTFTGKEDTSAAQAAWIAAGSGDPKGDDENAEAVTASGKSAVAPGASQLLLDVDGPRSISSVRLALPGVYPDENVAGYVKELSDDGRAHNGYSQFTLAIDPGNSGVVLKRRFDYGVADQTASVSIKAPNAASWQYVGDWATPGSDVVNHFRDARFVIPASFTANKGWSSVSVRIEFKSSASDWNEFRYWALSIVNGAEEATDELDVGNPGSESAHAYEVGSQTWAGDHSYAFSPDATPPPQGSWSGRAHTGASQFRMAVDPKAHGAVLRRTMDYGVADQTAEVSIDGVVAGTWQTPGSDPENRWRDAAFVIPPKLVEGKSSVLVKLRYVSGAAWTEFRHYMYSSLPGKDVQTDAITDVTSDSTHEYQISGETWSGSRTFTYPPPNASQIALNGVRIRMTWDAEATPSVNDVPLGPFFGPGAFGAALTKSLMMGMRADGELYSYFPMPFARHAKIELVNTGTSAQNVLYTLRHKPFVNDFGNIGYFRTSYTSAIGTPHKELLFVETTGRGHVVAVVESVTNEKHPSAEDDWYRRGNLEGDEHVVIDGLRSPSIHGTGTEDLYNGAYYFINGPFTLPVHGNTRHIKPFAGIVDNVAYDTDSTSMYRLFLADRIPYNSQIRFTIEHEHHGDNCVGPLCDIENHVHTVDAQTLAHYYSLPTPAITLTDTLVVGNTSAAATESYATSEGAHDYAIVGETTTAGSLRACHTFEGEFGNPTLRDQSDTCSTGRSHKGSSTFTMALDAKNQGAVLRRLFDQTAPDQRAKVYVDGVYATDFYKAGKNASHAWREEEILLPAALTAGKSSVRIKVELVSSSPDWNESEYRLYAIAP